MNWLPNAMHVLRAVELVKSASANFPVDTENQAHRAAGRSTH
jgi:hypothetical protein